MSELVFVKYCPLCGTENPRQQAFCLKCLDGDLSTVPVEPRRDISTPSSSQEAKAQPEKQSVATACMLELVEDPAIRFTVRQDQTVGRTEKADVVLAGVPKAEWISGAHARFLRRGEQWYIQHIGHTNFVKVDGETYTGQEEVAIYHGSIVVLSLTSFRVNLEGA